MAMDAMATIQHAVTDPFKPKTLMSAVITYGAGFIIALAAIGLAFHWRDEKTGKFGFASYATGFITPALIKVIVTWLKGQGVGEGLLGGIDRQMSAVVLLVLVMMFTFDRLLGPALAHEATEEARTGTAGFLSTIMFAIPNLLDKEKAKATKTAALAAASYSGGGGMPSAPASAGGAAPGGASASATSPGTAEAEKPAGGQPSLVSSVEGVVDQVFKSLEQPAPGVGAFGYANLVTGVGARDDIFMALQN